MCLIFNEVIFSYSCNRNVSLIKLHVFILNNGKKLFVIIILAIIVFFFKRLAIVNIMTKLFGGDDYYISFDDNYATL